MSNCAQIRDPADLCYNEDIQSYLPNMPRSRPLYRFSNRGSTEQAAPAGSCGSEDNLRMESMLLRQNKNVPIGRCSTPVPEYCSHCDHRHGERCCQYVGDAEEDIRLYSMWTQQLRNPAVKPQDISRMPEVVSSGGTPEWFPQFSYNKPELIEQMMQAKRPAPMPPTYSAPIHQLTHYQQYLLHLQQLNQLAMETPYYGHPYGSHQPVFQQFYTYNVFNGPVYLQQNNQSPHFHQVHHHFAPPPQPQPTFYQQQVPVPPRVPPPNVNYFKQPEFDKQYYAPYFANPTSQQVPPDDGSYPLWMLFWNSKVKQAEQYGDMPLRMEVDEQMRGFPVAV